jgi:hypothetical protein
MILVTQKYRDPSRDKEFARCERLNESASVIDHIEAVDGESRRWTFGDLYGLCCEKFSGKLCVIANSDIAFDATYGVKCPPGQLMALTRWEDDSGPRFIGHQYGDQFFSGSQDSWAFIPGTLPRPDVDIPMGWVACDQVIAGWACRNGVRVTNPSLTVRTRHIHASLDRPDRPSVHGYYGYPQITTLDGCTGLVLCHHWPNANGKHEYEWSVCRH